MGRPKGSTNKPKADASPKADNVAPYFRKIFDTNRKLLRGRSNKQVLLMWKEDHPEFGGVIPDNVKSGLANVKSNMRSKMHKKSGKRAAAAAQLAAPSGHTAKVSGPALLSLNAADNGLEELEIMIDDCMDAAKKLNIKGLDNVIKALRIARRRVVWKLGEE